jgi:predicted ArsR family transcriptional regulator
MRHKAELSPTARLTLRVLADVTQPQSFSQLAEQTGASEHTIRQTTQDLTKRGLVLRQTIGGMSYFTISAVEPVILACVVR